VRLAWSQRRQTCPSGGCALPSRPASGGSRISHLPASNTYVRLVRHRDGGRLRNVATDPQPPRPRSPSCTDDRSAQRCAPHPADRPRWHRSLVAGTGACDPRWQIIGGRRGRRRVGRLSLVRSRAQRVGPLCRPAVGGAAASRGVRPSRIAGDAVPVLGVLALVDGGSAARRAARRGGCPAGARSPRHLHRWQGGAPRLRVAAGGRHSTDRRGAVLDAVRLLREGARRSHACARLRRTRRRGGPVRLPRNPAPEHEVPQRS
jgi:hypothetical protein